MSKYARAVDAMLATVSEDAKRISEKLCQTVGPGTTQAIGALIALCIEGGITREELVFMVDEAFRVRAFIHAHLSAQEGGAS